MNACEAVRENLSAWLDGELEQEREAETLAHAAECEECRSFLETCRLVSSDLRLEDVPVPETLIPGVMRRLAEEKQTTVSDAVAVRTNDRRRTYRRIAAWACAAACLALVIFAGPWNWRAGSSGSKADMAADTAVNEAEAWPADGGKAEAATAADAGTYGRSDEAKYEMYDADDAEVAAEEAKEASPEEMPTEDSAPAAWRTDALIGDYAAVITVYGDVPESVLALSEGVEETPNGTAWLIPPDMADELSAALEKSGTVYEWLSGGGETSDRLLVCTEK